MSKPEFLDKMKRGAVRKLKKDDTTFEFRLKIDAGLTPKVIYLNMSNPPGNDKATTAGKIDDKFKIVGLAVGNRDRYLTLAITDTNKIEEKAHCVRSFFIEKEDDKSFELPKKEKKPDPSARSKGANAALLGTPTIDIVSTTANFQSGQTDGLLSYVCLIDINQNTVIQVSVVSNGPGEWKVKPKAPLNAGTYAIYVEDDYGDNEVKAFIV